MSPSNTTTGPIPIASAMMDAVRSARTRLDENRPLKPPRLVAAASACDSPRAVSGGSCWPCHRPASFQVDSPWRINSTLVVMTES
jgi:hypothetical protein